MTTTTIFRRPPAARHGFILAHETLWQGVTPAERDGENRLVLYSTRAEAEAECVDAAEMRADALVDEQMVPEDGDDGLWVVEVVLHPDGALTFLEARVTFTTEAIRELLN